jgi:outer membrane protein
MPKLFLSAVLICLSTGLFAQKFGHVNYGNLLSSLPEIEAADKIIKVYQDSLSQILNVKEDKLMADFEANKTKYASGSLTQMEVNAINNQLNSEQQNLVKLDNTYKQAIFEKRQLLLEPLIQQLNLAIKNYGKREGYTAIFDESSGTIMYDSKENDLTETILQYILNQ